MRRPFAITLVVTAMLVMLTALLGVLAASLNDFVAMLPDFNRALTRKIVQLREYLPFSTCISIRSACCDVWIQNG